MLNDELLALFDAPPRAAGPTPLWWWSGAPVTADRLAWQLRRLDEGGIHNLVVINLAPAGPLFGAAADDPLWFSEDWWDRFRQTCEIAKDRDMRIWFYDQIGFSGANIQGSITHDSPTAQGASLRSRQAVADGGRVSLRPDETLIGAFTPDGRRVETAADGGIVAADGAALRLVTTIPTAFDYLRASAVDLLIDRVHGEYERRMPEMLGTVIPGSFQDELPATNAWTEGFADEFRDRRGYDLLAELPALFGGADRRSQKVRGDYYAVRTALTEEAFFRPLAAWHDRFGMRIGADQSSPARAAYPTQGTQLYSDYPRTHRWFRALGSDHEGDSKAASSLAHLYDHEDVWLEAFHSSGWGGTLEDTWDWLMPFFRSGATLYNPHATYFGTAGGWFEWAPPSTDWRQPYWADYPAFSRAVARISSMLRWGTFDAEVALLHPTAVAQAGAVLGLGVDHFGDGQVGTPEMHDADAAQATYLALNGSNNWFLTTPGGLDAAGVAYDVVDDASAQRGQVESGALSIGGHAYRAVVLPGVTVLETATAQTLIDLLAAGGRVLAVGAAPEIAAGVGGDDAVVQTLSAHPRLERFDTVEAATAALGAVAGHVHADVPVLTRRSGDDWLTLLPGTHPSASGVRRTEYASSFDWVEQPLDRGQYAQVRTLTVRGSVAEALALDPASGERIRVAIAADSGGQSILTIDTGGAPGVLVLWRESPDAAVVPQPVIAPVAATVQALETGWTGTLEHTLDNTWGDLAMPAGAPLDAVQVWTMDWREGDDAAWSTVKATFGETVAVAGPFDADDTPAPLDSTAVERLRAGTDTLGGDGWSPHRFSRSRGAEHPGRGALGNKGNVLEEFVRLPRPAKGQRVIVRTLVTAEVTGPAELIVLGGGPKELFWNGLALGSSAVNIARIAVEVQEGPNVLEYRVAASPFDDIVPASSDQRFSTGFALFPPGAFGDRPVFMTSPADPSAGTRFVHTITLSSAARSARLVVGATTGVTVAIDGHVVARQEKVDYYEGAWGAQPSYFTHDVTALLDAGEHRLELRVDPADHANQFHQRDAIFADLVATTDDGVVALVSGPGWPVEAGGSTATSEERLGAWEELSPMQAAPRGHLLPDAEWLAPAPVIGGDAWRTAATVATEPARQQFRFTVPAGAVRMELPLGVDAQVTVDAEPVALEHGFVELPAGARTREVAVTTVPTTTARGGSAWRGPVRLWCVPAPITLGTWDEVGLAAWSGGVRYEREIDFGDAQAEHRLLLGDLRGSLSVEVDGDTVGERFCAPFAVDLGIRSGRARLAVVLRNTLGPFLAASTPTTYVPDVQRRSGLVGPVTLETRPAS